MPASRALTPYRLSRAAVSQPLPVRLALALGPIRAAIRVVDRSPKPMSVDYAQVGKDEKGRPRSLSYTDFAGGHIRINSLPIVEEHPDALGIVTGFGLHEASHCQEGTKDRFAVLVRREDIIDPTFDPRDESTIYNRTTGRPTREVPVFRPLRIAAYLLNLADDVRVEGATAVKWPGFGHYFEDVLDYLWREPEAVAGDSPAIAAQLRLAWYTVRYGERAHDVRDGLDLPGDLSYDNEHAFWTGWLADYLADRVGPAETVRIGLDHLAIPEDAQKELAAMAAAEQRETEAGERLRAQIERLIREGVQGAPGVCVGEDGEFRALTDEEAEAVDDLVREGLVMARPILTQQGDRAPDMRVTKPLETTASRRSYIGSPTALVEAMRASLVFRRAEPRHDLKLQERGTIDDEELWRWGAGDYRVFSERVIESHPDTAFGLLVDISGSMAGEKLRIAQRLAQTFLWALHDAEGVEMRVWAHTTDGEATIFRLYEPGDPMTRLGLIDTLPHSGNYDGPAIGYCAQQLLPLPQPQKVLIVLSDGLPNGFDYGGEDGMRHVRRVVDWARRQGVEVFQVAIDDDIRPTEQAMMYGEANFIGFTSDAQLPRDLTRLLGRLTQ